VSLPELIEALEREARAEAERELAQAGERAAALRAERLEARERRRSEVLGGLQAELDESERDELSRARREARRRWLEARGAAVERVLVRLLERLGEPAGRERVRRAAPALLAQAFAHAGDGPCTLRCGDQLADLAEPLAAARPGARLVVDASAPRRLLVEAREGALLVDATPDELLRSRRARLAVETCRRLQERLGLDASELHGRAGDGEA
jgi:vacuolar-type H+-ATPase subunit E/Vma4